MLKALRRIVQELNAAPDYPQALALVVERIAQDLEADVASIFLVDEDSAEYVLTATYGLAPELVGKVRLKLGQGLVGLVGEREELINVEQAREHPHFLDYPVYEETAYQGFMGVPLMQRGELLGVLVVQQQDARKFAEEEEAFLITLSTQLGNEIATARAKGVLQTLLQKRRPRKKTDRVMHGVAGAPGVAIGQVVVVYPPADLDAVPDRPASDVQQEINHFETALADAREEIQQLQARAKTTLSVAEHALFDAYLRILDSRSLMKEVTDEIKGGIWAQGALKRVIKKHVLHFESLDDPYLQERAADFRDLGRRILCHLQAKKRQRPSYPEKTLLVSEEVTATMLMEVPESHLLGVISGAGSANSHVAILARALGLPTVMGVTGMLLTQLAGTEAIVDGYNGHVFIHPSAALKKDFRTLLNEEQQLDDDLAKLRDLPAETQDGHAMALYVNTGLAMDGGLSLSSGAEGVGLYRTEMPFMLRDRFPSESEQRDMYRQLLHTFAPRPVCMRTLDIGGDKSLPYFPMEEENPFLGWRGIRVTLDHPEIFLQQVRAMLSASVSLNNLLIMLPMISSVREVETALRLIAQAFDELTEEGLELVMPRVGLMIEVPSAVYQAEELARRVDFLSVGSNDLIQYLLAVDRNNPRVANLYTGYHPAVLRALFAAVKACHKAGKPISICGELAGDPVAVVLLLAMGFDALSMSARSLLRVKWVIRAFTFERAKALLKEVLEMDDPKEIHVHMEHVLEKAGLGGLIRAGL